MHCLNNEDRLIYLFRKLTPLGYVKIAEIRQNASARLGKTVDEVKCKGCREQGGCTIHEDCLTLECVKTKGVALCSDCCEFPAASSCPCASGPTGASQPENLQPLQIKLLGSREFMKEAGLNRKKYFMGRMVIGAGPQLPE